MDIIFKILFNEFAVLDQIVCLIELHIQFDLRSQLANVKILLF